MFLELQDRLDERFPDSGSFLLVHISVEIGGEVRIIEWSEAVENHVRERREEENEDPHVQTLLTTYFN